MSPSDIKIQSLDQEEEKNFRRNSTVKYISEPDEMLPLPNRQMSRMARDEMKKKSSLRTPKQR